MGDLNERIENNNKEMEKYLKNAKKREMKRRTNYEC